MNPAFAWDVDASDPLALAQGELLLGRVRVSAPWLIASTRKTYVPFFSLVA
jgi:hypothetical protein